MKTMIMVLALFLTALTVNAQTQFDYLGGMPINSNITGCFYIDLNTGNTNVGINDVKFVHGNGEIYFEGIYADSAKMTGTTPTIRLGKSMWNDCNPPTNVFDKSRVYVMTTLSRLSEGSHVLPFKYNDLCNYIVLRVEGSMIYIRGWKFNIDPQLYECYRLSERMVR
jgi:hypothetical protein